MTSFEGENMQTQKNVLSYRIRLYFYDHNLETEIDENEHNGRNKKTKSNRTRTWL